MTSLEMVNAIIKGETVDREMTTLSESSFKQIQYETEKAKTLLNGYVREFSSVVQVRKLIYSKQRINRSKIALGILNESDFNIDQLFTILDYLHTALADEDVIEGFLNVPRYFNKNTNLEETANDVAEFFAMLLLLNALNEEIFFSIISQAFAKSLLQVTSEYQELIDEVYKPEVSPNVNFQIKIIISIILHIQNNSECVEYKEKIKGMSKELVLLISQQFFDHIQVNYSRNTHRILSTKQVDS